MATIMPEGENIRKAIKWISETQKHEAHIPTDKLVAESCAKFDLSPKEADYLHRFLAKKA